MRLVVDIESTGLNIYNDEVLCVIAQDFDTGEIYEFRPDELQNVGRLLESADKVIMHNGIAFDAAMLWEQGWAAIPFGKIVDTLVLSRLYYPDREGGHSLENWGKKLGFPKIEFDDFSQFSEDMLTYCKRDVELTVEVYMVLLREKGDWDWDLSERIEHRIQAILYQQEKNGWKFRVEDAKKLVEWLEGEMEKLESKMDFGMYYEKRGQCNKPFKNDGNISEAGKWCEDVAGPFGKIEWHPIRLSQREKVAQALQRMGWEPTSYTEKGSPQLTPNKEPCPNLEKFGEIGKDFSYYSLYSHRKGLLKGLIEHTREDGRVPAKVTGLTNTGRLKHGIVTNIPQAEEGTFLGKEIRALFTVEKGYKQAGIDADSLELRVAGHYTGSEPFIKALVEGDKEKGTDAHSRVWKMGEPYGLKDRFDGKKANYTGVYGASGHKFAAELKVSKDNGFKIREVVANAFPGLLELKPKVEKAASRGYLIGIDGRKVWMRRDSKGHIMKHKALNTLFQSAGGILMKAVLCWLNAYCKRENLDVKFVGNIHDEIQAEVAEKDLDRYSKLCYTSFHKVSEYFQLRCPISCEVLVGEDWSQTH